MSYYDGSGDKRVLPTNHTVTVVSSGMCNLTDDHITLRKNGRLDWSLYYCKKGTLNINDTFKINQGELWIYPPYVTQKYTTSKKDNTSYRYIHFTGSDIKNLLTELDIKPMTPIIPKKEIQDSLFKKLEELCLLTDIVSSLNAENYMIKLLLLISSRASVLPAKEILHSVTDDMAHSFSQKYNASYYADKLNLSVDRFNHLFKEITGISPYKYYLNLRIENACELLSNTKLKINKIAEITGFETPLYFTQAFKKHLKMTPSLFRSINQIK